MIYSTGAEEMAVASQIHRLTRDWWQPGGGNSLMRLPLLVLNFLERRVINRDRFPLSSPFPFSIVGIAIAS